MYGGETPNFPRLLIRVLRLSAMPSTPRVKLNRRIDLGADYCYAGVTLALLRSLTQGV